MPAATDPPPPAPPRGRRRLATSAWLALLVLVVTGFGFVATRTDAPPPQGPPTGDVAKAEAAIETLMDPARSAAAVELLPADFTAVTGVVAGTERAPDGTLRAVHVGGGCSAPWGEDGTRWDYGTPCKAHDLGYDLLRYAERKGHPLRPGLREALDHRLSADMGATCERNPQGSRRLCDAVASLYSTGLVVNSWHQRWGPPVGEPVGPMLAGVLAIALLLVFRMRGWHAARGARPRPPAPEPLPYRGGRWTLLGAGSIALLVLGDAGTSLARWAGADEAWLWPLTWLTQLAFVFFFAGGHANLAGWRAVTGAGGGYREYLAHRAGWLLRLALVFAVVAFAVPLALELLGIPENTVTEVVRIALHPLWLLGLYVLTVAATPLLWALHRRAPGIGLLLPAAVIVLGEAAAGSAVARHGAALALALLAQQLAFWHAGTGRTRTAALCAAAAAGLGGLALAVTAGGAPLTLLGAPGAPPELAGPTLPVALLGIVHLSLLALFRMPLARLARQPWVLRAAAFARRAPMSSYLGFLATMSLLVALVYLPEQLGTGAAALLRPASLLAPALLAVPGAVLFWWFERHLGHRPPPRPTPPGRTGRLDHVLARAATGIGIGYATVGVFGLALSGLGAESDQLLLGLALDPIQSLVHLLLGMSLLHTVRTGASSAPGTWSLTAVACVPPLLSAVAPAQPQPLVVAAHGLTALFAVAAGLASFASARDAAHARVA
ncbi:hypothetical protein B0I33_103346 [Prauserella shujinwangii]|uniref:Phospholipase A2-like protein n=1 Tax=Prauserella shujinwangii TaxID=1453103 RepID=A0A2T0LYW6_9PSEU|nr:phospholipase [Prauserella shujinwangii]PRX49311.1 hypothetical protein B0I33_103346 [Prauserella shujinwangii]